MATLLRSRGSTGQQRDGLDGPVVRPILTVRMSSLSERVSSATELPSAPVIKAACGRADLHDQMSVRDPRQMVADRPAVALDVYLMVSSQLWAHRVVSAKAV
jgi:hypothetical protein